MARIPVYTSHRDAMPGEDYRIEHNDPYVVHVCDPWPDGVRLQLIDDDCAIAGVSAGGREAAVASFARGRDRELHLVAEPKNRKDKNAIAVWGRWRAFAPWKKTAQLGYVPKRTAKVLASRFAGRDYCTSLRCVFLPRREMSPGVRFRLAAIELDSEVE